MRARSTWVLVLLVTLAACGSRTAERDEGTPAVGGELAGLSFEVHQEPG